MKKRQIVIVMVCVSLMVPAVYVGAQMEMVQIPTLQTCNKASVKGEAKGMLRNAPRDGMFWLKIEAKCSPRDSGFPEGMVELKWDRPDADHGYMRSLSIDQLTFTGKVAPMAFVSGRCDLRGASGCRYWIMLADESQGSYATPDVVSFVVLNGNGDTIGHGAGPVREDDIVINW